MSDGSAPEFTIPTHFDNPARPRPEFTPMPFDAECPTGIPPKEEDKVDTESKRIRRALQDFEDLKEEHKEQEEGWKAAYEADLENWEQEEELRQWKQADYIAHAQREVEERKREEQCRASAAADASPDVLASTENQDEAESEEPMKLIADDPVFQAGIETGYQQQVAKEEEGQKTQKGKGKERSAETEWGVLTVSSMTQLAMYRHLDERGLAQPARSASPNVRTLADCLLPSYLEMKSLCMDMMEEKVDKMIPWADYFTEILASLRKPRFDRVVVPPAKKKGSKGDKRPGPKEAEGSKLSKKRKRGDDDDEEYEGELEEK
ncbi:hypothetical protein L218DRAFT_1000044 [Marasmius fiardii PR-910]|nr:hypothetical protein L218DRAFT_1000044 [Marasmius fiardii PR-910]